MGKSGPLWEHSPGEDHQLWVRDMFKRGTDFCSPIGSRPINSLRLILCIIAYSIIPQG